MRIEDDEDENVPDLIDADVAAKRIPVSILTGFLGSGKTTLLNHLLTENHGKRIAVIENEFSEGLGIEGMIARNGINGENLDNFFELNNGCICCSVKDGLLSTLEQLVLHKDSFDYIVIETTGVANPGPIISIFWADDGMDSVLYLDGVVCAVDCANFTNYLKEDVAEDLKQQISYADRILLNKTDLVDESVVESVRDIIIGMNSLAELQTTVFSKVSPEWVLGIGSYNPQRFDDISAQLAHTDAMISSSICIPCVPNDNTFNASNAPMKTPNSISRDQKPHSAQLLTTEGFQFSGSLNLSKVSKFLDNLLYGNVNFDEHKSRTYAITDELSRKDTDHVEKQEGEEEAEVEVPMRIYRMKGILHIQGSSQLHILQAVHDIFEVRPSSFESDGEDSSTTVNNKVIAIGRNIDRDYILSKFLECL